jgi:hypothetical protein
MKPGGRRNRRAHLDASLCSGLLKAYRTHRPIRMRAELRRPQCSARIGAAGRGPRAAKPTWEVCGSNRRTDARNEGGSAWGLTRRLFLEIVEQPANRCAVRATQALGLQEAVAPPPFAPVGRAPAGVRVLVFGAGIAGLTAAYELQKLATVWVIEARTRAGGRACTVRRGTVVRGRADRRSTLPVRRGPILQPGADAHPEYARDHARILP